jgi:4-aminobutyrate aminotransferase-like enzyme
MNEYSPNLTTTTELFNCPEEILRKKREYLFPCLYHFYSDPMQIIRGEGVYLFDHRGKRYLDCYSGVGTMGLGHSHPEVMEAVCSQAANLVHTTTIYLTQQMVDLAEQLAVVTPPGLKRSFFCASGSEAVETAILLASLYTRRPTVVALTGSLHGRTKLGMSLTGLEMWRTDPFPLQNIAHAPQPYCYQCPLQKTYPECHLACVDEVERIILGLDPQQVSAVILEPIQGNGGIIVPPLGYLARLSKMVRNYGILLILDEIQTGFCRTGRFFACQHEAVTPEILCLSKAIGNGFPLAATVTTDVIAAAYHRPGASTYGGNLVSSVAGLTVLKIMQRDNLAKQAESLGEFIKDNLERLQNRFPLIIGNIRGRGLMWGIELIAATSGGDANPPDTGELPIVALTNAVLEHLKDQGILLGKTGLNRNVLTIMPPLIISQEQLQDLIRGLEDTLAWVQQHTVPH